MHAGSVPVPLDGFRVKINGDIIALGGTLEKVTGKPNLVACVFSALGEDLVFPLAHHDLGVDTFGVQAGFETQMQVLVDQLATFCVTGSDRRVVRSLGSGVSVLGKTQGEVGLGVDKGIFLFETKPKVIVVFVDGGSARSIRGACHLR